MLRGWAWLGVSLVLAALSAGLAAGRGQTGAPGPLINEVAWGGTAASASDEWMELFNPGLEPVDLAGWRLVAGDGEPDVALRGVVPAGGYFLLERTDDTTVSDIPADLIYTGALHNAGETLALVDGAGTVVDTANGDGGSWPAGSGGPEFRSMARSDAGAPDTDGNWHHGTRGNGLDAQGHPISGTPQQANGAPGPEPTATPTAGEPPTGTVTATPEATATAAATATSTTPPGPEETATPVLTGMPPAGTATPTGIPPEGTATPAPTGMPPVGTATPVPTGMPTPEITGTPAPGDSGISLNEFMPDPAADWNGDGTADENDEYIELFNGNDLAVDLGGWALDDVDDTGRALSPDGSRPYVIPAGTTIPAGGFLLFYRSQTRVMLNNDGDTIRLLGPGGGEVEAFQYRTSRRDEAYSKVTDGGTAWTRSYPPSPGAANPAAATPEPPPGATPTPSPSSSPTGLPATPAPPEGTPTPAATQTPYATSPGLNEFMPDPNRDWNGDGAIDSGDEYIELYNGAEESVDLGGWMLDDEVEAVAAGLMAEPEGTAPYVIPAGTSIAGHGFLVFYRSQTGVALNNEGDSVRLLWPDGGELERYEYGRAVKGGAFSKMEDGGVVWTVTYPPSPNASNQPGYGPDDVVRLNEVLASPRDVDWDDDGIANYIDEWIEIFNAGATTVDLGGWKLADGPGEGGTTSQEPSGRVYTLPAGAILAPGELILVFRQESGLALDAGEDWVRLLLPDGGVADLFHYDGFSGYDRSWCRLPDGTGSWSRECQETPGQPNLARPGDGTEGEGGGSEHGEPAAARPTAAPNYGLVSIAAARGLADGARVELEGQVTVLPNVFDDKQIYIQDATGGLLVYLRSGEWPPLSEGQWVRVRGRMGTLAGEREIKLTRIDDISTLAPEEPPRPVPISPGEVGEAYEGRLVMVVAPVVRYWGDTTLYLEDRTGRAKVTVKQATGMRRPYVQLGALWMVTGIVSQYDDSAPYDGGYRLLPRRPADLQALDASYAAVNSPPLYLPVTGEADRQGRP